jgi:hypothetical protein
MEVPAGAQNGRRQGWNRLRDHLLSFCQVVR